MRGWTHRAGLLAASWQLDGAKKVQQAAYAGGRQPFRPVARANRVDDGEDHGGKGAAELVRAEVATEERRDGRRRVAEGAAAPRA